MCKVTEDVPGSCERHRSRRHRRPKTIQVCARARALRKVLVFVGQLATHATIELSRVASIAPTDGLLISRAATWVLSILQEPTLPPPFTPFPRVADSFLLSVLSLGLL